MDFSFSPEQERLRDEVSEFLNNELRAGSFKPICDPFMHGFSREFSRKVGQKGWIGMTWPKEVGGQAKSYTERNIVIEELMRCGAPIAAHYLGDRQIGPSLIAFGSDALKEEFIPRIISGEIVFTVCISEPEAGSDLASLKTRAIEENGHFVIDGQKLWASHAHLCDYCYVVARTDPNVAKHKGISEFIVDVKLPGISIRPIADMSGHSDLCEVFFDSVKIPSRYLVGQKNRGWHQILSQLDYERGNIDRLMANYPLFKFILNYVKDQESKIPTDEFLLVRDRLAQLQIEFEIGRLLVYRAVWMLDQGQLPTCEAAMSKLFCTQFEKRLDNTIMQILGPYGQLVGDSKYTPADGMAATSYLFSPCRTIQGGTTEALKNIMAIRGLGLPR